MLKHTVKAGDVTHLTDARYFAAWEVESLGFNLQAGSGISALELKALREWITGPKIIGELGLLTEERLPADVADLDLDGIQLNELVDINLLPGLKKSTQLPISIELAVQGYHQSDDVYDFLIERKEHVDRFILNFTKGGVNWQDLEEGTPVDLDFLQKCCSEFPILLEIEGELPTKIKTRLPELQGFSLRGGAEEKVGYKDFDALADFFEDLEVEY